MNRFPVRLVLWFYKVCAPIWNCTKDWKGVQLTNCWHGTHFLTINLEEILLEFKDWIMGHYLKVFSLRYTSSSFNFGYNMEYISILKYMTGDPYNSFDVFEKC